MKKPRSSRSTRSVKQRENAETSKERKPTLDAIRALVAFANAECSVSAAARMLECSQPVVSMKLKAFQGQDAASGAILLERDANGRSLRLTEAGESALPAMRELVRQYDQLLEHLREGADSPILLKLAVGAFSAERFVPAALAMLRQTESAATTCVVKTSVVRGRDRIIGVANGVFDLAIVSHSSEQIDEVLHDAGLNQPLVITPLAGLSLVVAAGKRTPEAKLLAATPEDRSVPMRLLEQFELAGPDSRSGVRRQLEQAAGESVRLTFSVEGGGWSAAREFARHGLGVAVIPPSCLSRSDQSQFVVRNLDARIQLCHSVIYRTRPEFPPALVQLRDALIDVSRDSGL